MKTLFAKLVILILIALVGVVYLLWTDKTQGDGSLTRQLQASVSQGAASFASGAMPKQANDGISLMQVTRDMNELNNNYMSAAELKARAEEQARHMMETGDISEYEKALQDAGLLPENWKEEREERARSYE